MRFTGGRRLRSACGATGPSWPTGVAVQRRAAGHRGRGRQGPGPALGPSLGRSPSSRRPSIFRGHHVFFGALDPAGLPWPSDRPGSCRAAPRGSQTATSGTGPRGQGLGGRHRPRPERSLTGPVPCLGSLRETPVAIARKALPIRPPQRPVQGGRVWRSWRRRVTARALPVFPARRIVRRSLSCASPGNRCRPVGIWRHSCPASRYRPWPAITRASLAGPGLARLPGCPDVGSRRDLRHWAAAASIAMVEGRRLR